MSYYNELSGSLLLRLDSASIEQHDVKFEVLEAISGSGFFPCAGSNIGQKEKIKLSCVNEKNHPGGEMLVVHRGSRKHRFHCFVSQVKNRPKIFTGFGQLKLKANPRSAWKNLFIIFRKNQLKVPVDIMNIIDNVASTSRISAVEFDEARYDIWFEKVPRVLVTLACVGVEVFRGQQQMNEALLLWNEDKFKQLSEILR